jgi:hypothetical protein
VDRVDGEHRCSAVIDGAGFVTADMAGHDRQADRTAERRALSGQSRPGSRNAADPGRRWPAGRRSRPCAAAAGGASTWLNAGVPSTQVAEWAGHSLAVLLQIYAKCLVGQEEAARRRIDAVLGGSDA